MTIGMHFPLQVEQIKQLVENKFEHHSDEDLSFGIYEHKKKKIAVFSISYLVDTNRLVSALLSPLLQQKKIWTNESLINHLPLGNSSTTTDFQTVLNNLITGAVIIYIEGELEFVMYDVMHTEERALNKSETESNIIGPQVSLTESLDTNLNVIRQFIVSTDLVIEKLTVGTVLPREVRLIYMKTVANETDVNTMRQRITELEVDEIEDAIVLKQYIEDSTYSIFPQFDITELPAQISYVVKAGKIVVLAENSPNAFIAPSTFFSFFETLEDNYLRWIPASALRMLRMISVPLALLLTPLYVSIVSFRYELIPTSLLMSIGQSRAGVPFPPLIEAIIIELMIELLREAGVRLPTKIGETMGIVGGLVIGTAAVEAGLTSNVLIIVVSASALASFTTNSYLIGTSFRVLRFVLIVLAGMLGLLGVLFGISFIILHLLRTTSLGRPYLAPLYPFIFKDFNQVFYKLPPSKNSKRATMYRPKDQYRYSKKKAEEIKDHEK